MSTTPPLAFSINIQSDLIGQLHLVAEVVRWDSERAENRSVEWSFGGTSSGAQYDGFRVGAMLGWDGIGASEPGRGVWAVAYEYQKVTILHAAQARAIAQVLAKLERGLAKINSADGYLPDSDDYAGYLLRVGRVLGIRRYWVRNSNKTRARSGEYFRVDGSGLQSWAHDINSATCNSTVRGEYL